MAVVFIFLSSLALILFIIYLVSTWKYNYWKNKNVPHLKPTPLVGNFGDYIFLRKILGQVEQDICRAFPREPYVGAYYGTEPALILQGPEYIKLITTKDFTTFNGREITQYTDRELITGNLFFTYGDRWKVVRTCMSPLFTSSKIKNMFHLVEKCTHVLEDMIDREVSISDVIEARSLLARYTMDCICSCGFGVETNTMGEDVANNPFTKIGDLIFENSTSRGLATLGRAIWPNIFYGFRLNLFPKTISEFFHNLLKGVFESRNYEPSARNDFVDMLLNLKKNEYVMCDSVMKPDEKVKMKIDDEFMVAQCIVFFAAGYETSATTLSFALYELAKDKESQRRAIEEVDEYLRKNNGKIEYECVNELPYLEACLDETMRLYPVLTIVTREVMQDYTLPTGLKLERGLRVHLPIYHMHRHPDFFPEPEEFKPERFLPENKHNIKPYTYLPFGEGPRICLGLRVAKMQMLPGLVTVLKKYRVELAPGTPRNLEFDPRAFVIHSMCGLNLKFVRRDG